MESVPKTGLFLNLGNFAMVSGRKVCDMSKVRKFCLQFMSLNSVSCAHSLTD